MSNGGTEKNRGSGMLLGGCMAAILGLPSAGIAFMLNPVGEVNPVITTGEFQIVDVPVEQNPQRLASTSELRSN